jgi:hypothetical protein
MTKITRNTHPREYSSYQSMRQRCLNSNNPGWKHYGGRDHESGGPVTICERWLKSFAAFVEDMGSRPEGTTLDRIASRKGYTPTNARWADKYVQARNRDVVEHIHFPSGSFSRSEVAAFLGRNPGTVTARRNRGYGTRKSIAADLHVRLKMADKYDSKLLDDRTVKALAAEARIPYATVLARIQSGVPVEDALKPGRRGTSELARRAAENGVAYHTAYARVKAGWSLDDAVSTPSQRGTT